MAAKKVVGISTCPGEPGYIIITALLEDGSIYQKAMKVDKYISTTASNWQEVSIDGLPEKPSVKFPTVTGRQ